MRWNWIAAFAACIVGSFAQAQPFNVRAWYAEGQVFVVWQQPAPPAVPTDTVEIYASPAAQVSTANMTLQGRLFFPEYTGARLQALVANARLQIPTPAGGLYRLAVDEGVFVYTPQAAGNLFFAAVNTGAAAVNAGNSAATAFNYDPVNEPVRPHPQFSGTTAGGNPFTAFVVWADGRNDYDNARPDIPVLADADKNGVPHVFTISYPLTPLPNQPLSCLFALHGGGGEYQLFRPGEPARANLSLQLTDGVVITPDDSYYARNGNLLERNNTSWFGYATEVDPFFAGVRVSPPLGSVVVNFTQRRVLWILDYLLRPTSPLRLDPTRVAMIGHSGGGRGTSHLTRSAPERFCAAVCYTPAADLSQESMGRENYLRGNWDDNNPTNLIGPNGTLGVTDVFTMTTRLSPTHRDFAFTRTYHGKRDEDGAASWSPVMRGILDSFNDSRMGYLVSWDEREHGVEKWNTDENDLTDDPAHTNPWPDIGQWIAPIRTRRCAGQYLLDTYRAGQSYPGIFNADADLTLPGRQPDPGPGNPDLGDVYGAWGGYCEWDTSSVIDTPRRWACTLYLTGLSATSIDNSPYEQVSADIAPRKVRFFAPPTGLPMSWRAEDLATGTALQLGSTTAELDGVVVAQGVEIPRDPARIRFSIFPTCVADVDDGSGAGFPDGGVTIDDLLYFLTVFESGDLAADVDDGSSTGTPDGGVTIDDLLYYLFRFEAGC